MIQFERTKMTKYQNTVSPRGWIIFTFCLAIYFAIKEHGFIVQFSDILYISENNNEGFDCSIMELVFTVNFGSAPL